MAYTTPHVEQNLLVLPANRSTKVAVGSPQWYSWLIAEENGSFFFADEMGSFTARKERRKRGGWYWIAYRSRDGKLHKTYLGRSEDLTPERLRQVTQMLSLQRKHDAGTSNRSQPLIEARFTPPALLTRERLIEREHLFKRLNECLQIKLAVITAPAGAGKTTLLSMWYETYRQKRRQQETIRWISLDERDNDPTRFWRAIRNVLQGERDGLVKDSVPLATTPHMTVDTVVAALANSDLRGILILDDYHLITTQEIHEGMQLLIKHLPPDMHIVVSSRSEPPLALGRARIYGEVVELQAQDLRFTREETQRFLEEIEQLTLSSAELDLFEQRTEGWIAGLRLASLALRKTEQPGEILTRFSGDQRTLFDYFANEVFARLSADMQHFLLHTALLPILTPQLCAIVLDKDPVADIASIQEMLLAIERANLFIVPLDSQRQAYRYHALFSEFLQARLAQSNPGLISQSQKKIAGWYEQQGLYEEAIEYFLAAREAQDAGRLIARIGEDILWRRGEVRRLQIWLEKLPPREQGSQPHLDILSAWAMLMSGQQDLQSVEHLIEQLEHHCDENTLALWQGDLAALRARIAGFRDDKTQVIIQAQQALQLLPTERALLRADIIFGLSGTSNNLDEAYRMFSEALHISQAMGSLRPAMFSSRYLAVTCVEQGRMAEAEAILQQALQMAGASDGNRVPVTSVIHIGLAELLYERNELTGALRHALLGIELGERSGEIKAVLSGCCVLSQIFATRGEYVRGWQELLKAERVATIGKVLWLRERIAAGALYLSLLQQDLAGAKRALEKIRINTEGTVTLPLERLEERLLLARVWLVEARYRACIGLLNPIIETAIRNKNKRMQIQAQLMQAIAFYKLGEQHQASRLLQEALPGAMRDGYRRLFLDMGEPLLSTLRQAELAGDTRRHVRLLLDMASANDNEKQQDSGLSEREYEVLQLVATGMSNQEIAQTLIIAPSTVKAHVQHLCQKLGVQKRLQAVTKARELGLL